MEVLQRPIHRDEPGGKKVEERLIRGVCALNSKITGGCNNACAEVPLPETISNDAGGQGISGIDDPLCQLQAATRMFRDDRALHEVPRERGDSTRDSLLLNIVGVSTNVNGLVSYSLDIGDREHLREGSIKGAALCDFGVDSGDRLRDKEAFNVSDSRWPGLGNELKLSENLFSEPPLLRRFIQPLAAIGRSSYKTQFVDPG